MHRCQTSQKIPGTQLHNHYKTASHTHISEIVSIENFIIIENPVQKIHLFNFLELQLVQISSTVSGLLHEVD